MDAGVAQEALRPAIEKAVEQILEQKERLAEVAGPAAMGQIVGSRDGDFYIDQGQIFREFCLYTYIIELRLFLG